MKSSRPRTPPTAWCKKRTVNYWMHLCRPFECKTIEESAVSDAVVAPLATARDENARGSVSLIRICSHMVQWDIEHCLSVAWKLHALASTSRDLSLPSKTLYVQSLVIINLDFQTVVDLATIHSHWLFPCCAAWECKRALTSAAATA